MRFAVIGTFCGRHENSFPLLHRLFVDGTRQPDECLLMCETREDKDALWNAWDELQKLELIELEDHIYPPLIEVLETPTTAAGGYAVIPYANKINWALDHTEADAVVYLDNGSMPGPDKYRTMAEALERNPDWGQVYVTQKRTGFRDEVFSAEEVIPNGFCVLNYTQVMHRVTEDRWPMDMMLADPDLADAYFWDHLSRSLGPVYPAGGSRIHDDHHIPSPAAAGI